MAMERVAKGLGRQVLLVEEQMMLMLLAEEALLAAGYRVATAASFHGATRAMTTCVVEAVVLDLHLVDQSSFLLADELTELGIPVMFASTHHQPRLPQRFAHVAVIGKPYLPADLLDGVASLLARTSRAPVRAAVDAHSAQG